MGRKIQNSLIIENLRAETEDKEILKGVSLTINPGEVHALMGPNGSGKSTFANVLAGHPHYTVSGGRVFFWGKNVLKLRSDERAKLGIFLALQHPIEVPGVGLLNFLKTASTSVHGHSDFKEFSQLVAASARRLHLEESFLTRAVNEGFSGGEKKKAEILQMLILKPKMAILDETDSGLDVDALRIVAEGINQFKNSRRFGRDPDFTSGRKSKIKITNENSRRNRNKPSVLLITHYFRILKYVKPDYVHVMMDGKIVRSGGPELATKLEEKGYDWLRQI